MRNTHTPARFLLVLFVLLLCAIPMFAQLDTGNITGTVKDNTGAVISGASVTITNVRTGRTYEIKTDENGNYSVLAVPASVYRVEVKQQGFKAGNVSDLKVDATQTARADLNLQVGATSEVVNVFAETASVNTQTSDLGASVDSNRVSNLPLNGRDFTSLVALVPGAVTTAQGGQQSIGGFESMFAGVNVLLDGADATRIDTNATSTQLGRQESRISRASVDSIQEFRVLQSTYSAEYGRSMGDVLNVITKSGGNNFHGTLFEYLRNNKFDARNYFARGEEPLRLNQFGGNISGPLVQNKLFFFFNYEGVRQSVNTPVEAQVLSAHYRGLAADAIKPVIDAIPVGNGGPVMIDTNDDDIADAELRDTNGNVVREYYYGSLRNRLREDTGSVKVDWIAGQNDTLAFRYNVADSYTSTQYGVAAGQTSPSYSRNHLFKTTWNHTFSPTLLNEFGIAFNRPKTESLGGGGQFDTIFQCFFCNDLDAFGGDPNAFFTMGTLPGPALFSSRRPQLSFQIMDTVSAVKGRHAIRFGFDMRHARTNDELEPQRFMTFAGPDFLAMNFAFQVSTLGYNEIQVKNSNWGFFFQDDIRVTDRLTINAGLRYDYNSVLDSDQVANFDIPTATVLATGAPMYEPDYNNFAPRVGFAYDPFGKGKTVVRGGYGIFYNPLLTGTALSLAGNNQPGFNMNFFDELFGARSCDPALSWGWPLPAELPVCTPAAPISVNGLDRNLPDSMAHHWSFGVQQELFTNTVLEVAYRGNKGENLPAGAAGAGLEMNLSPFAGVAAKNPDYANIRRLGNFLASRYDAMNVSVRRRVANGLNVDANYTWAHQFDNVVSIFSAFQDSNNPMADWSEGDIDVRHNFTLGLVYDLPLGTSRLGKGWQISSLFQTRTGLPVNVTMSSPFLGLDLIRPNLVPGQSLYTDNDVPGRQFNPDAFADPGAGNRGNLRRNALRGPGFSQVDLALAKSTALTETLGLQFRVEMFNVLNRPNFANPIGVYSDTNFGKSKSTVGNLVGTGTARQTQFALKLMF